MLLFSHLISCIWLIQGRINPDQQNNWIQLVGFPKYKESTNLDIYVNSLFFTTSTMTGQGFASIYPRTNLEYFT